MSHKSRQFSVLGIDGIMELRTDWTMQEFDEQERPAAAAAEARVEEVPAGERTSELGLFEPAPAVSQPESPKASAASQANVDCATPQDRPGPQAPSPKSLPLPGKDLQQQEDTLAAAPGAESLQVGADEQKVPLPLPLSSFYN